ncbi:MAG: hypothetical protein Q9173_002831 [Seirophora scorigena]
MFTSIRFVGQLLALSTLIPLPVFVSAQQSASIFIVNADPQPLVGSIVETNRHGGVLFRRHNYGSLHSIEFHRCSCYFFGFRFLRRRTCDGRAGPGRDQLHSDTNHRGEGDGAPIDWSSNSEDHSCGRIQRANNSYCSNNGQRWITNRARSSDSIR